MTNYFLRLTKNPAFVFAFVGIIIALLLHLTEIYTVHLDNHLHQTADDASYIRPAYNLLDNGTWKDSSSGPSSYVQRAPLMGLFHLLGIVLFHNNSAWFIFIVALLFHGIGIYCLYKILINLTSKKIATVFTALFIILPCFYGFLSYSITEAFVISFILIATRVALISEQHRLTKLILVMSIIYLFRPVLVLIFIPILIRSVFAAIKYKTHRSFFSNSAIPLKLFLLVVLATNAFWEVRKYQYTENFSPLPIYHQENGTIFKPAHQKLTELFKIWEVKPEVFHYFAGRIWTNSPEDKMEIREYVEKNNVPISVHRFQELLIQYGHVNHLIEDKDPESRDAIQHFSNKLDQRILTVKKENRLLNWVITPLLSAKENILKSQINFTLFQETWRGNFLVEFIRYFTLIVLLLCYTALIISPIFLKAHRLHYVLLGALLYFGFLIFYQRLNEDRYFLPLIAIGFIALAILTFTFSEQFRKRKNVKP